MGRGFARDGRATAAGAPLFALAAVVLLLAAAWPEGSWSGTGPQDAAQAEAAALSSRAFIERAAREAWSAAAPGDLPDVRARGAADAVQLALLGTFPQHRDGAVVTFAPEVTVRSQEGLLLDLALHIEGPVTAVRGLARAATWVEVSVVDPARPIARAVAEEVVVRGPLDPFSPTGAALRRALAVQFATAAGPVADAAPAALARALEAAGRAAEVALGLGPAPAGPAGPPPPPARRSLLDTVRTVGTAATASFAQALCGPSGCTPAVGQLLSLSSGHPDVLEAVLEHVAAQADGSPAPLGVLPPALADALSAGRAFLEEALDALRGSLERASLAWRAWADPPGDADGAPPRVAYAAASVQAEVVRAWGPVVEGATVLFGPETEARVRFDLTSTASIPLPDGAHIVLEDTQPVDLTVAWAESGPLPRAASRAGEALTAGAVGHVLGLMRSLEAWAMELSARMARLKASVSERVEKELATALSRLVFRVLDAAVDGDGNRTARALFALLSQVFANDLRDALTVNFTAYGRPFRLVPDPLRQQVTLETTDGPHTFGVRVRHIGTKKNPFVGPRNDPFHNLALELIWNYRSAGLRSELVVDPFMRSEEGMVRFHLVAPAGRGLSLSLVAPQVSRVSEVLELSLSKFVPGGVPLAPTPTGGILSADLSVRAEFLELRRQTVVKWVVEAMEAAWIDVVDGMSVREAGYHLSHAEGARLLAGRFLSHLADVVAAGASKLLSRLEISVSVTDREGGGAGALLVEASLTVLEPAVVFREMASDVAAVATAGSRSFGGARPVDLLPEAVQSRVGISLRMRLSAGGGLPASGSPFAWPSADLGLEAFISSGSLAASLGREGVRSEVQLALQWQGFTRSPRGLIPHTDVDRNDRVDVFRATARSLVGTRLLISEVMAAPDGPDTRLEYIELYNPGFAEARLDGWTLRDASGRAFPLPLGTRLAPGAFLVVARSLEGHLTAYGRPPGVSTLTLALNDGNDSVELVNAEGWASDRVSWGGPGSEHLVPAAGQPIVRRAARVAPVALPGSAVAWTGSPLDFELGAASPGSAGPAA